MAIADVTLLSGFHALRADLEKVWLVPQGPLPFLQPLQLRSPATCRPHGRRPETLSSFTADFPL